MKELSMDALIAIHYCYPAHKKKEYFRSDRRILLDFANIARITRKAIDFKAHEEEEDC
jgi:TfoX/Sxy family transcriptional regulator of competence genes